jgi:arabinofuranosyltransferase
MIRQFILETDSGIKIVLAVFCFFLFVYVFLVNAWAGDDAYITFRVVDNFIGGRGLVYNVGERVQAYTSPLWFFLMSFFYYFSREPYFTALGISLILNVVLLLIVGQYLIDNFKEDSWQRFMLFVLLLINSKAFVDYTSSGLENSLAHLIAGIFFCFFIFGDFGGVEPKTGTIFTLFFTASLGYLTRQDDLLLFIPVLLYSAIRYFKRPSWKKTGVVIAGVSPVFLWTVFSLVYYGFPFPNTAYAKLNSTFPIRIFLEYGKSYYLNSLKWDPTTLVIILIVLVISFLGKDIKDKLAAGGIGLYLLYVLRVGGDFMSGRFFTGVYLVAVLLLIKNLQRSRMVAWLSLFFILMLLIKPGSSIKTSYDFSYLGVDQSKYGYINDEKGYHFEAASLIDCFRDKDHLLWPAHGWVRDGLKMRLITQPGVLIIGSSGYYGYFCGPLHYIIDRYGLTNALLARIPAQGCIGHFARQVPAGYPESLVLKRNLLVDPDLKQFYEILLPVIRGPVFNWERFKNIFYLNTGKYNYLIKGYF